MKRWIGWGSLALLLLVATPLQAEETCKSPDALGVSRTIEVDTTKGPWFGEPLGNPDFLQHGEVVLTFDDGPAPSTVPILAALAAQCTKATFFMVGEMAAEYPHLVREVIAQGHTVGTHTWSHANLKRQSFDGIKNQIESGFTAVEKAAGTPIAPFFRYPYLNDTPSAVGYLQGRNIGQFAIDIDTLDWLSRNAQSVVRRAMAGLEHRGRGIILMHDIHPSWDPVRVETRIASHVEKVALVGDPSFTKLLTAIGKPFITAQVQTFEPNQYADAQKWVQEGLQDYED